MGQAQDFKVGDNVLWEYADIIECGTIAWIENNLMGIHVPDEGKFKFSTNSARKINGQWLGHRPYQGYQERLHKG